MQGRLHTTVFVVVLYIWLSGEDEDCIGGQCSAPVRQVVASSTVSRRRSLLCKDPKNLTFCFYAISVANQIWDIYRTFSPRNVEILKRCTNTTSSTYGFSYRLMSSGINYVDDQKKELKYMMDIFYYCCKNCSKTNIMGRDQLGNYLSTLLLENLPKRSNETYKYTPGIPLPYCLYDDGTLAKRSLGIDSCVFLLDSSSPTRFYAGPFSTSSFDQFSQSTERINNSLADVVLNNFSTICPESKCLQYLSPLEFFFYCCCESKFEQCAYSDDEKLLSYASMNAKAWLKHPEIRAFQKAETTIISPDSGEKVSKTIYGRSWLYRNYVYSMPKVDEQTGKMLHNADNVRLFLCAMGSYNVTIGRWKNEDFRMRVTTRDFLQKPQRYCLKETFFQFDDTDRSPPTSIAMKYEGDTQNKCTEDGCFYVEPKCVQDLITKNYIISRIRCCCSTTDVCNHYGNHDFPRVRLMLNDKHSFPCLSQTYSYWNIFLKSKIDDGNILCFRFFTLDSNFTEVMLIQNYTFFDMPDLSIKRRTREKFLKKQLGCHRKEILPLRDPFCGNYVPLLLNFAQCSCLQSLRIKQPCDANFHNVVREMEAKISMPECYKTIGDLPELRWDNYDFGIVGQANYKKVKTTHHPLCYDMVAINVDKHGIEHRSGHFDEIANFLYEFETVQNQISRIFTIQIKNSNNNETNRRYVSLCYADDSKSQLCNGHHNIRSHLVPMIVRKESLKDKFEKKSRCFATGRTSRVNCKTRYGCFDFHTVHGMRLRHCIDKIPKIVRKTPALRLLYACYSHIWINSKEEMRCAAVTNNDYNTSSQVTNGIICCCSSTCNVAHANAYADLTDGYFPFDM